jgi:hypothetical protein
MSSSSYPSISAWRRFVTSGFLAIAVDVGSVWGAVSVVPLSPVSSLTPASGEVVTHSFLENPPSSPTRTVRFEFTNLYLEGADFINLSALATGQYVLGGTLISLRINASVSGREPADSTTLEQTWASDLTVLVASTSTPSGSPNVDNSALQRNLLLQVGGTSGLESTGGGLSTVERTYWYANIADDPESSANSTYSLLGSGILLATSPGLTDPVVWLGHGFTRGVTTYGSWSGYVDFTFASSGGSGVPDASRTALLIAPGTLLLLGLAGRSRRRS